MITIYSKPNCTYCEKAKYLLVKGHELPPLLFTSTEVERARKRAEKNPEDTQ